MEEKFIPDAYCGLYCASCPSYMATEDGSAEEKGLAKCRGCKSEVVTGLWCSSCYIKSCARGKGLDFCNQCGEYPCDKLDQFKEDSDYPYHSEIYDYLSMIKNAGQKKWMDEMKKRWSCPQCGKSFNWWTLNCGKCGYPVNGYKVI